MPNTLVLIHGYSDEGPSFLAWKNLLIKSGLYKSDEIQICNYRTLTNEVNIKDIAEGFDRAIRLQTNLNKDEPFDAMVHSTGMLVLRSWMAVYGRHKRVKRVIAIAPASFGSPLAHKGRSFIGALFKGNRDLGPDFMEAGNLVLDGLELGSKFTWDLAHKDLLVKPAIFGPDKDTPYLFTFCGDTDYSGLKGLFTKSNGTDGTVRWAGCALNCRKIPLDLTWDGNTTTPQEQMTNWSLDEHANLIMPLIPIPGLNHATILEKPSVLLQDLVTKALKVDSMDEYKSWIADAKSKTDETLAGMAQWQQFVVRAKDERGDPINDFNLQLFLVKKQDAGNRKKWKLIDKMDVHTYAADNSFRCFHLNLKDIKPSPDSELWVEFIASSGTRLLGYFEYLDEAQTIPPPEAPTFIMNLTPLFENTDIQFFYPFTTTLIEITLNREPLPLRARNEVLQFM
jgi:pimeloyl-ACP methyl ester carboxylesterase